MRIGGVLEEVRASRLAAAKAAITAGRFKDETVRFEITWPKWQAGIFDQDEHPRFGLSMADLAKLKPVFKQDGTVTAENSSGLNVRAEGAFGQVPRAPSARPRARSARAPGVAWRSMGIFKLKNHSPAQFGLIRCSMNAT